MQPSTSNTLAAGTYADPDFSRAVIDWQQSHGRHALPWQNTRDAYRIWLSEIMLQQTQVTAVIPYYQKFLLSFPDVAALAGATSEQVMSHWSGLGYYTRARNLHQCAKRVVAEHGGLFPADPGLLADLPGIGRSTAAAISAFAYGTRAAILDGNVKRVFTRVFGVDGYPGSKPVEDQLWRRAVDLLPQVGIERYTQGLMDLGATLCTRSRPDCARCPLAARCVALATDRVHLLPVRKPKKAVPQRQTSMLVVIDQGQVLLEQRPDSGIWGGLLSLPELEALAPADLDDEADGATFGQLLTQALAPFGVPASCARLTPFSHVFTHFKLQISPYEVRLSRRLDRAGQDSHVWYPVERLADAPLPAPVKKLLLELLRTEDLFAPERAA
ncbi:A/G-specific adenine glycosylase [Actimicrobium sp. CCC2.4]|uniref:A/G-specific adenine glycosylase n=1 Tax=Actimicrobium sp. CCC2.4 TaxID=3048606 RepID=UPI002AC8CBAC|nr:A/G-specific adenine glycosylase [Actimicrobium sp. CCC2.4]MEB0134287.1 A/G-specific adenine glycosylase [Actimicrobium sp. CCC2.4]WPX32933.1 A/G-specific adenine glycosylase [Actimicrobium sp. CCC2.4]